MRKGRGNTAKFPAVLSFAGIILAALIGGVFLLISKGCPPTPGPDRTARLEGKVADQTGAALGDVFVSLRGGPQTTADTQGKFVLNDASAGDQMIIVKTARSGEITQSIKLQAGNNSTNVIYDSMSSRLGLLSISAPVDESSVELIMTASGGTLTVYGRCDGLRQMLGDFDVWMVVKPRGNSPLYVQHPAAIVDSNSNSWRADIALGDALNPPKTGDQWTLIAVAVKSPSEISRLASVPNLNSLPPHLSSNVVTFTSTIPINKR